MSASSFNRPGAVDLSQLAERAKQSRSSAAPAGARSSSSSYVLEVTEQTFDALVVRASLKYPVVVELYSPRVATGAQLSDALAAVAADAGGKFLVARLNVDNSPQIVQALRLQAVPTVVGVIGGQIAPLFQGVLPKDQVKTSVDELLKAAVANGIVGRAEPVAGQPGEEPVSDEEQVADPRFAAADEALERGDYSAAQDEFEKLLQANPSDAEAKAGKAQAGLLARTTLLDPEATMAKADAADADVQSHLDAADIELVLGRPEAAFDRLIGLVRTRSGAERDQVRVRLLELFETVGSTDPRVLKARRNLMTALF